MQAKAFFAQQINSSKAFVSVGRLNPKGFHFATRTQKKSLESQAFRLAAYVVFDELMQLMSPSVLHTAKSMFS